MLEGGLILEMVLHQGRLWRGMRLGSWRTGFVIFVVRVASLAFTSKVLGSFVFVRSTILKKLAGSQQDDRVRRTVWQTYEYLFKVSLMLPDENSYNFLLWPKMMTATSTEQRTASSCAFLNRPPFRFKKVL